MLNKLFLVIFSAIYSCLFFSCDDFPRDTRGSLQKAQNSGLQVGVTENPPFVVFKGDSITGTEVEIVKDFAKTENLEVRFIQGSESELVKKLEKAELHIMIGGFDKNTDWKKKVAMTSSYDSKHIFFIPRGENGLMFKLEAFIFKMSVK